MTRIEKDGDAIRQVPSGASAVSPTSSAAGGTPGAGSAFLPSPLKVKLGVMMFMNYVVWGSWYVTITTYLTQTLHFTGTEAGAVFSTVSVASMVSPFFVGLVADRYFATERVMGVLYVLSALCMYFLMKVTAFPAVYALMLAFCLCFFPTVTLSNSIGMRLVENPGREFPAIRLMGTFGWIFIGNVLSYLKFEATVGQFEIALIASLVMSVICVTVLPHTPPIKKAEKATLRSILGLDALVMLKDRAFLVFIIASIVASIPITFYYSFANDYMNSVGVANVAGKMTLGQVSEAVMMILMPFIFRFATVRGIFIFGLLCWTARYLGLSFGNAGAGMWMFYLAILLHGASYDFFFLTGQLYTDQVAPAHLRNSAQGFIFFCTWGLGMLIGSLLSGMAVDYFTTVVSGRVIHNWFGFWFSSAVMAFIFMLLVIVFFRTRTKIRPREDAIEVAPA